jgi:DNA-binding XRE family transcriptional regulator
MPAVKERPILVIERMREELGLSRKELARELGINYTTVYRYETEGCDEDTAQVRLALIGIAARRVPYDPADPNFRERLAKLHQIRTLATEPA